MYSPLAIANTIISMRPGFDAMWLNKAVYAVHGWSLAFGKSIVGELPQVWRYGPIYASLYNDLRHMRREPVTLAQPITGGLDCPIVPESDEYARDIISKVLAAYGSLSSLDMSAICHAEGTPWKDEARTHRFRVPHGHAIPEWRLRRYFSARRAENENQSALEAQLAKAG